MRVSSEIVNLYDTVYALLVMDERLRDSDKRLSARVWSTQLGGVALTKKISAYEFLCMYVDEKTSLYSQESIGRARRKVQEEYPHLRGSKWLERKEEEDRVKIAVLTTK